MPRATRTRVSRALVTALAAALPAVLACTWAPPGAAATTTDRVDRVDRTSRTQARRVDRVPVPRPAWVDCGGAFLPGARCARVALPLDYDHPTGPQVAVALLRIPAARPAGRIGTLFVNPGGPGGSGIDFAAAATTFLGQDVLDRFDIVGFDPRGTNASTAVRCWPDAATAASDLAGLRAAFPRGGAQDAAAVRSARAFGRACAATGQPLAAAMSTAQVARDLDVLRRMVGDRQLTYLGFSYGTYLGQVYANLFPDRVRALALDGVVDPAAWAGTVATRGVPQTTRVGSARASSVALRGLLTRCGAAGPAYCTLAERGDPKALYAQLTGTLKRAPIVLRVPGWTQVYDYPGVVALVQDMLYDPRGGDDLDSFLTFLVDLTSPTVTPAAAATARTGLRRLALRYAAGASNAPEAFQAVLCTDGVNPADAARWPGYARSADRRAPGFGALWAWSSAPCASATWTARDEDAYRGPFTRRTAHPVLLVGARWDPATPYAGAVAASRLLPRSRLLTSLSWGHTSFGTSGCVTGAVQRYLVAGVLPATGARCTGDVQPFTVPLDAGDDAALAGAGPASGAAAPASGRRPPIVPLRP